MSFQTPEIAQATWADHTNNPMIDGYRLISDQRSMNDNAPSKKPGPQTVLPQTSPGIPLDRRFRATEPSFCP